MSRYIDSAIAATLGQEQLIVQLPALNGKGLCDCIMGGALGLVSGNFGGAGYIPFITKRFGVAASYYVEEAIGFVTSGVIKGNAVSAGDTNKNYCAEKVQGWFGDKKQENSDAASATQRSIV